MASTVSPSAILDAIGQAIPRAPRVVEVVDGERRASSGPWYVRIAVSRPEKRRRKVSRIESVARIEDGRPRRLDSQLWEAVGRVGESAAGGALPEEDAARERGLLAHGVSEQVTALAGDEPPDVEIWIEVVSQGARNTLLSQTEAISGWGTSAPTDEDDDDPSLPARRVAVAVEESGGGGAETPTTALVSAAVELARASGDDAARGHLLQRQIVQGSVQLAERAGRAEEGRRILDARVTQLTAELDEYDRSRERIDERRMATIDRLGDHLATVVGAVATRPDLAELIRAWGDASSKVVESWRKPPPPPPESKPEKGPKETT